MAVHQALHEVVLGALLDGFNGHLLVVESSEHDDRGARCLGVRPDERRKPLAVR